jgi:hypothetical protein
MSEISVTVVGSTTINPTVGNGDTVNVTIASTGERGPTGATGSAGPANVLTIGTVTSGTAAATITGTAPNQTLNLVLQKGDTGTNVELQATGTHIQWRLAGASTWTNLVALSAITGPTGSTGAAGAAVELQASGTHIQWRYVGGSTWTNVVALSSLVGATGATGATGPQGPAGSVNLADETPQPLGAASAGTALTAARADHVHAVGSITYSSLSGIPSTFAPSAHSHAVSDVTGLQTALDGKQAAGTYATLVGGTVPSSQLPSYVDDVIEYANLAAFPATNDGGKILVARDTGKIYRWSGSAYIEISPSPGSTDSVTEGSTNLYHTNARAAAAAPVHSVNTKIGAIVLSAADVGAAATSHTHTLADLTQSSATAGQVPTWNGSAWAAATPSPGGVTSVAGRTGTVTLAQLASSGTASDTTFLRGDGAWAAAGGLGADDDIDGGWFYGASGLSRSITITSPPTNQTASSGAATFAVTAIAEPSGTLNYQWQKSDAAGFAATQRTLPASANWISVAYGGGTFVAVAGNASTVAATSADGITWTQRTLPTSASWRSVTYGSGTFLAVATDGQKSATSTDGITWTQRTLPTSAAVIGVTYGDGRFVAVGANSTIAATSTDGITWTLGTLPTSAEWKSVAYGGGTFVAVAYASTIAATSADGITWTQRTLPTSAYWNRVTYGSGTFVAVALANASGGPGAIAATSTDGITWTQRTLPAVAQWDSVTYGNGAFLAVATGGAGTVAATSTDGIAWTQRTLPASANWQGVTYVDGTFVLVASGASIAATIAISGQAAFANISGATSSLLALTGLTNAADHLDRFRVVVSAANASSVTSQPATLTVS